MNPSIINTKIENHNLDVFYVAVRANADWKQVKDKISPGNLSQLGIMSYANLAAGLNLLDYFIAELANLTDNTTKVGEVI